MINKPKAVVLLSGGLDSTTNMAIANSLGYEIYALSFRYGQRHQFELEAAKRIAEAFRAKEHIILNINLDTIGGSALTDHLEVPKGRASKEMVSEIPITYVPARNTIFLSFALAVAEVKQATDIFIGVNAIDYSGYPDCRPEFIEAFEKLANLATKAAVEGKMRFSIQTPLLHLTKAQIIQKGMELGVDYGLTHTCYDPDEKGISCGECDACQLRLKGFQEAGYRDPLPYQKLPEWAK
ncbi:MAG: 7-cyano-7-deazaguanine synthase QueC [Calditrichia bacterium]